MSVPPAIELSHVTKRFDATVALDNVDLAIDTGAVHALLGENGAGKSTVVKLLSGLLRADSGTIRLAGEEARLGSAAAARRHGIATAFQEMTLVRDLTVAQNLLLPLEPTTLGQVSRRRSLDRTMAIFDRLEIHGIDPRDEVRDLELPLRQKLEIAKAVSRDPRILLLDEPTSTLSYDDVEWLGRIIARLHADGVTIVFITHRMREVRLYCDRLSVLRNGAHVGTYGTAEIDDDAVIQLVIGRSIASTFPPKGPDRRGTAAAPALAGKGLGGGGTLADVSFALWPGEILGVAGLQGMGQLDLFLGLFGVDPFLAGTVEIDGKPVTIASPGDAVAAHMGISLVPEDRKSEGLFLKLSGSVNVSLPVVDRFARFGLIDVEAEHAAVDRVLERLRVDPRALYTRCAAFSGGNQQKMAIGKWLLAESRILLLYDPTRGVDVGTKHEIYVLAREFAAAGGAVLFYSTEVPELVNLCDRVLVLYRGRLVDELVGDAASEAAIMRGALGGPVPALAAAE
ncbi:MAG: sugar ABC transporter ATP-binding protein [Alphaproteobacteria bacterium]|nr:sugar ABC transporter ATP-binding protein [Alphaproteobacteria bacterium]